MISTLETMDKTILPLLLQDIPLNRRVINTMYMRGGGAQKYIFSRTIFFLKYTLYRYIDFTHQNKKMFNPFIQKKIIQLRFDNFLDILIKSSRTCFLMFNCINIKTCNSCKKFVTISEFKKTRFFHHLPLI